MARHWEGVSVRAVEDVLRRCRHSTYEDHTRDATEWVSWEVQQDTAGGGKMLARWLKTSHDDLGSSDFSLNKNPTLGCVARRRKAPSSAEARYKPKLSISELSNFACTVFTRKGDTYVSKLILEGMFVGYTEGDHGCLVYAPNKVVAVLNVIIK